MKQRTWIRWVGLVVILIGFGILIYPTVSNWWNQNHASRLIADYETAVSEMADTTYDELYMAANLYNQSLLNRSNRFVVTDESHAEYMSLLDVTGTGIMCYVEIPKIRVSLPVYHTVDDSVLQVAVGHLEGTSFPIGGPSTHSAISGHTGMVSAKLFTSLEDLEIGDVFYLHVLGQSRIYQVDQIDVVLPEETDLLEIVPDEDYCTLITCTPYGVNSHRLLVRGSFAGLLEQDVENPVEVVDNSAESEPVFPVLIAAVAVVLIVIFVWRRKHG